jgi:hypothetical protein
LSLVLEVLAKDNAAEQRMPKHDLNNRCLEVLNIGIRFFLSRQRSAVSFVGVTPYNELLELGKKNLSQASDRLT